MDPELRAANGAAQLWKKKPPKLKTGDRTMSLAIDNYLPSNSQIAPTAAASSSGVAVDPALLISGNLILSPPPPPLSLHLTSSPIQELRKPNIFYMESSSNSLNNYADYPHSHQHHMNPKPNIRRSDTLNVYDAAAYEMRKASSFNANEVPVQDVFVSRRTNSMRHTTSALPYEKNVNDGSSLPLPAQQIVGESGGNRRNCRMHKSFHERRHDVKKEKVIDAIKCHSLGDDGSDDNVSSGAKRKLSPKFNSDSLENEVFHTRNSDSIDAIEVNTTSPTTQTPSRKTSTAHKHSSHSLDKPQHNFRRIARATQSFYLNPTQFDELRLQRAMRGTGAAAAAKRMHSASMRTKPFRETLTEAKKSKSFINDPFATGVEYELSPHRRDSKLFAGDTIVDVKKSPRLSSGLMLPDTMRTSYESQKSSNYDGNDLDYDVIMRAYRQNRRKSSILSAGGKKKSASKKKSIDGNGESGIIGGGGSGGVGADDDDGDGDTESTRKRKRIVCIIVSVFLSLVFASVFVVVFTLTHSTMTQVQDNTRRVYTFAPGPGNRDMPIHHHNVRQENERIMQESINRGKYVKNFTHAAFVAAAAPFAAAVAAAGEEIP